MTDDELALALATALGIGALLVVYYSGIELHNLSTGIGSRDPEVTPGSNIRRLFLIGLVTANIMRIVGLVMETVLFYIYHNHIVTNDDSIDDSVWTLMFISRLIPSLVYASVYSLISVYFAQLCYTVSGLPFFHVRNFSVFGNLVAYLLVIIFIAVAPTKFMLWWTMFCSYGAIFTATIYYGYTLYTILPGSTAHHQFIAKRLMTRFYPLFIICTSAALLGTVYYFLLVAQVLPSPLGYPSMELWYIDFAVYGLTEIVPSLAVVLIISKRSVGLPSTDMISVANTATGETTIPPSSSSGLLKFMPAIPQVVNNFLSHRSPYERVPSNSSSNSASSSSVLGAASASGGRGSVNTLAPPPALPTTKGATATSLLMQTPGTSAYYSSSGKSSGPPSTSNGVDLV